MDLNNFKSRVKKGAILVCFLALGTVIFSYISTHAYIDIQLKNAKEATIDLYSDNDKKNTNILVRDGHVKRFIKKGTYGFTISSNDSSYVQLVAVGGYFSTTHVEAALVPEVARTYIGDDPSYCMIYDGAVLVSNNCAGSYGTQKSHVPATKTTPTHIVTTPLEEAIEGSIKTTEGSLVMVNRPFSDLLSIHSIYTMQTDTDGISRPRASTDLPTLDVSKTYKIMAHKTGFIVYDDSYRELYYYSSLSASRSPQKLSATANDKSLSPVGMNSQSDLGIVAVLSNITAVGKNDTVLKQKSEAIVLVDGQSVQHYAFTTAYTSGLMCSKDTLCMQNGDTMDVYAIKGDKTSILYSVHGIKELVSVTKNLLSAVTKNGLLAFDITNRTGSYLYSFGNYTFGNVQKNNDDYIISIVDINSKKSALLLTPSASNTDSIDKKIYSLQKDPAASKVSIYKNFIFIVPEHGELINDPNSNTFIYDPAITKKSITALSIVLDSLRIDRTKYTITGLN